MDEPITDAPASSSEGAEPTAQPVAPAADAPAESPPIEQTPTNEPASEPSDEDNSKWLESKGIDPDSPEAVAKLAEMARNAEKRMHESTTKASELKKALAGTEGNDPVPELDLDDAALDHPVVKQLVEKINALEQGQTSTATAIAVTNFFESNPDARQYETAMAGIVTDNPNIGALVKGGYLSYDQLYAMAKGADASRESTLKSEGGKEALERVAGKQHARAVQGSATTSETRSSITKANFDQWYGGLSASERASAETQAIVARVLSS